MGPIAPHIRDLIARYLRALCELGIAPTRVLVFGSQTNGTATEMSDIDLLVVSPDFAALAPPDRLAVLARANGALHAPIAALWATPDELVAASPASFHREILRTGIDIL
jgi:predicted nucleotidyltransferase